MSKVHLAVLGLLNEKPMYAYEFKSVIEIRGIQHWGQIKLRSVYKAMESLEKKGMITGEDRIQPNKSLVRVYTMTEQGRVYLRELVEKSFKADSRKNDFWLAVAFMFATTRAYVIKSLKNRISLLQKSSENTQAWIDKIEKNEVMVPFNYQRLVHLGNKVDRVSIYEMRVLLETVTNNEMYGFFVDENTNQESLTDLMIKNIDE